MSAVNRLSLERRIFLHINLFERNVSTNEQNGKAARRTVVLPYAFPGTSPLDIRDSMDQTAIGMCDSRCVWVFLYSIICRLIPRSDMEDCIMAFQLYL